MPNWACANYVASGDRVELEELVRTLNTMPNLLPDTPSGFGRYWLGNIFGAFGMTLEQIKRSDISCRGTFDPDFWAVACLCGPGVDESSEFCLSEDGRLRFSTISAWDKCDDIDSLIVERFPSVSLAWSGPMNSETSTTLTTPMGSPNCRPSLSMVSSTTRMTSTSWLGTCARSSTSPRGRMRSTSVRTPFRTR